MMKATTPKKWAARRVTCFYCECILTPPVPPRKGVPTPPTMATREHRVRRVDGGIGLKGNIVPCCQACNSGRGDTPWRKWREIRRPKSGPAE